MLFTIGLSERKRKEMKRIEKEGGRMEECIC
jgi:hypothetical protein